MKIKRTEISEVGLRDLGDDEYYELMAELNTEVSIMFSYNGDSVCFFGPRIIKGKATDPDHLKNIKFVELKNDYLDFMAKKEGDNQKERISKVKKMIKNLRSMADEFEIKLLKP